MCGIVGAVAQRNIVPVLIEGLRRLEYRGYDSCGVAVLGNGGPRARAACPRGRSRRSGARDRPRRHHGYRAYALGDARRAGHRQRAPDLLPTMSRWYTTASSRTTSRCGRCCGQGLRVRLADRYRSHRSSDSQPVSRRSVRSGARSRAPVARRVCDCGASQGSAAYGGRRAAGFAAGGRSRRGENFLASDALALAGSTERFIVPRRRRRGANCRSTACGSSIATAMPAQREVRLVAAYGGAVELGRTGTSCRRKSSSSRARSPTPFRKRAVRRRICSARQAAVFAKIDCC